MIIIIITRPYHVHVHDIVSLAGPAGTAWHLYAPFIFICLNDMLRVVVKTLEHFMPTQN